MANAPLLNTEARKKIKELAEKIDFAMMETNLGGRPSHIIPMSTKKVDDLGRILFLSNANSQHNANIATDSRMQLIYANAGDMEFMSLYGEGTVSKDKALIDDLYGMMDDMWFDGKDDKNVSVIAFMPTDGHYWDMKHNKLVSMIKMGAGIVTGKKQDLGVEGDLL